MAWISNPTRLGNFNAGGILRVEGEPENGQVSAIQKAMSNQAGKGDDPRPVNGERFRTNYDRIFKKHESNPINPHADDQREGRLAPRTRPQDRKPSV
jgi:hypothetical protein